MKLQTRYLSGEKYSRISGGDMDLNDQMQHQKELAERRRLWEEQRKAEAEQREREEKQARLAAWLTSRRQSWVDHTGSEPAAEVMEAWRMEYIAERAADEEAAHALRLSQAEDIAAGS
jgi:hypothetical protein